MAGDVTRDEFQHLATRTDILEREVEGEKLVTRHILEQTRRNGDDLATMRGEMKAIRGELREFSSKVETRLDRVERKVDGLIENLPRIVGDVVREVNSERDRKR
jgi:tetrahydromethanopterin S-methyltransferase subunit G